ncbi:MAG: RHS repeat-associated core domain-containing protein [Treponemataceae bacterium]
MPFRFTGKELDEETGLYYYGARYLDPKYSRWLSGDPAITDYMSGSDAGEGGIYNTVNLSVYHYAGNNPVKYVDPDGRELLPIKNNRVGDAVQKLFLNSPTFKKQMNKLLASTNGKGDGLLTVITAESDKYAGNTQTQEATLEQTVSTKNLIIMA